MNFREATDKLCTKIDHEELAKALGVSLQTVRQARMANGSAARRSPPPEWKHALIRLAEKKVLYYRQLVSELKAEEKAE